MAKLIIAAGKRTQERLSAKIGELEKVFGATGVHLCSTSEDLDKYLNDADNLLFYSDFPSTYNEVQSKVKQSQEINSIIGIEYVGDHKAWLYDGPAVANCISPEDDLPAIKRAVTVPKYVNFIGQWIAALFLCGAILGTAMYAHHYQIAMQEQQQQQNATQEINN